MVTWMGIGTAIRIRLLLILITMIITIAKNKKRKKLRKRYRRTKAIPMLDPDWITGYGSALFDVAIGAT